MAASGALSGAHLGAVTLQGKELSERRTLETQLSLPSREGRAPRTFPVCPIFCSPTLNSLPETCRDIPGSSLQVTTVPGNLCVQEGWEPFPRFAHML